MLACFGCAIMAGLARHMKHFGTRISTTFSHSRRNCCYDIMPCQIKIGDMLVKILPILEHNYMYMITDIASRKTVAIDPAVPELIFAQTEKEDLNWEHILITHHHPFHQQGNKFIRHCKENVRIIAGDDRIDCLDHKIKHFDMLEVGCLRFRCLYTPGHTSGHFCYYVESARNWARCIFTGDLLFSGGVGRLAEGTPAEMYHSLQILYTLPDDTRIFCGHESTIKNLEYAAKVEPENIKIQQRSHWASQRAKKGLPPMLSTIGQEKLFNPFMRVTQKSVQAYCGSTDPYHIVSKMNEELYKHIIKQQKAQSGSI